MLGKNGCGFYSLGLFLFLGLIINPAFAEVTSLQTNDELFYKGDQIEFSGTVETNSVGLVTIVIRDLNDEFVLLTQATINPDDTFDKKVEVDKQFTENRDYTAIGFILNMTQGATTNFDVSFDDIQIITDDKINERLNSEIRYDDLIIIEKPAEPEKPAESIITTNTLDFIDHNKDPYYYVERYYSEPTYKSWFDRNYPGQTIEEYVGYVVDNTQKPTVAKLVNDEIIPEAQASSIVQPIQNESDNSNIAEISLSIAALGILFGAVYGVKRQVDNNSKQISLNKHAIRKRILNPILGSNPKEILQTRLAKGEITLDEYEKLKTKLN